MAKHTDSHASDDTAPKDPDAGKVGYKALVGVTTAVSTLLARKALGAGWKTATGKEPPTNPEHPDVRWREAALWAVASASMAALGKLVAQRRIAATWRRASGTLPPGLDPTPAAAKR